MYDAYIEVINEKGFVMKVTAVLPYKVWVNKNNGRNVSIHGSVPWVNDADKVNWDMVEDGWTWEVTSSRGTVTYGLSRPPADTCAEAVEVMICVNNR